MDENRFVIIDNKTYHSNLFTKSVSFLIDFWECAPVVLILVGLCFSAFVWALIDFLSH